MIQGRYTELRSLGGTAPSRVVLVEDALTRQKVVLKEVRAGLDEPVGRRLLQEFSLLARVAHPRVAAAIDPGCVPARPGEDAITFFTTRYVEGPELSSRLTASLTDRLQSFYELLDAVAAVHRHGLRCGDLKPQNVVVGDEGVVLVDFGLTRDAHSLEVAALPTGTLPYIAPELLAGQAGDQRCDVFSLGVILFELLSGAPPFPLHDTPSSRLEAWQALRQPAHTLLPESVQHSLAPGLLEWLDRLLEVDAQRRVDQLQPVLAGMASLLHTTAPSSGPLPELPLLGRESELEEALQHYQRAANGGGLVVSGERGSGVQRFVDELMLRLMPLSGGRLLRIRSQQLQPEEQLALTSWLAGQSTAPPSWLAWLEEAILDAQVAGAPPPILILQGSFELPSSLRPGLWICAGLSGQTSITPAGWHRLPLVGLSESTVRSMVEQLTGLVRAPETIQRYFRLSSGNPALLRALLDCQGEMLPPSPRLLQRLRPVFSPGLDRLDPPLRAAARVLAVLMPPLNLELCASMLELGREQTQQALEALSQQSVLVDCAGGLEFRSLAERLVLLGELEGETLRSLHRRAGLQLERRLRLGASVSIAALAFHFDQAEDGERARRYLGQVLQEDLAAGRHLEVTEHCSRLLARLTSDDPERTQVYSHLGEASMHLQRFAQAEEAFRRAIDTLIQDELGGEDELAAAMQLELRTRLARALEERGDFANARQEIQSALTLANSQVGAGLHEHSVLVGRLSLALARVHFREGRLDDAQKYLSAALSTLHSTPHAAERVEAHMLDGLLRMERGELEPAAVSLTAALQLATETQNNTGRMRALHNLHILEARRGNLPAAVDYLQQALELAAGMGDIARLGAGYNNLGNLQRRMGDARKALKSYQRAARTFERVGDRAGLVTVHYSQADLLRARGELGLALDHLDRADALARELGGGFEAQALARTRLVRGELLVALGRHEEARPLLEASLETAQRRSDHDGVLLAELALCEISLVRGESAEVEERCHQLTQRGAGIRHDLSYFSTLARLHHHLGHHYASRALDSTLARAGEVRGETLFELVKAALPPEGVPVLRSHLEEASRLLDGGGRGLQSARARSLLEGFGAGVEERIGLLKGVLDLIQHLGDRRSVLSSLVSLAARVLRAERGALLYRRHADESVDYTVLHEMNLGEAKRVSGEIIRRVAQGRGAVIVEDALEDPTLIGSASIQDFQIRSVLGLLIDKDEQGFWILYLDHRVLPGVFRMENTGILERLSQLAAGLLREIRYRETLLARVEAPGANNRRYGMVGRSQAIERVREYIDNLGHLRLHNENLLFIGESGTGKELVARAVHQVVRAGREIPFIAQSCADIPAELIESTLFGHRRGAFTSAREDRPGIFELADGGVLFLDEIGELPINLQASLLRVLEERTVSRIGEPEKVRQLNLIVVCATNRDLRVEADAGRFRRDLFHRLNQHFRLPPLRERREDIFPLLRHFMEQSEDFNGLTPEELFAPEVLLWFHEHAWPGNIRELKNIIDAIPVRIRARRRQQVTLEDLGVRPASRVPTQPIQVDDDPTETLHDFTERLESGYIRRVMERCGWDITRASARLGLTYQGLRKRLLRYDWMDEVERRRR